MGFFSDDPADAPVSAVGVEADKIAKIKAEIAEKNAELLLHGKDRRIVIGRLLIQLRDLLAKQGSGTLHEDGHRRTTSPVHDRDRLHG